MTSLKLRTLFIGLERCSLGRSLAQAEHVLEDSADLVLWMAGEEAVDIECFLAAQQAGALFWADASVFRLNAATRCTKKIGGVTPLASAQASFSSSVWQQHLSQQCAALRQLQGHFSQGNRSSVGLETGIGRPVIPMTSETNRHATTTRVQLLRFGHFRLIRRMNT